MILRLMIMCLFLAACKDTLVRSKKTPAPTEKTEVRFEGLYNFEGGGYLELIKDVSGLIDVVASNLIYPNSDNGSSAVIVLSGTNLTPKNDSLFSNLITLSNTTAQYFRGNVSGNPDYHKNLNIGTGRTYKYKYVLFFEDNNLNIRLHIYQFYQDDTNLVYSYTIVEQ